ncbi:hypothetical protein AVEN_176318-1 [Araneus ventricosus]|uniref:Uncharacterized protein n=1 Tax=Araneus ventricosus TaxID=182803 RepID=A0A4Y2N048_ARAVE|nr:hypothetical protein AVEN_53721-1 [Araneus ventricosus]GBN31477.1 hypothetical protein AVEN_176318-1 [Araneus ventricosus]
MLHLRAERALRVVGNVEMVFGGMGSAEALGISGLGSGKYMGITFYNLRLVSFKNINIICTAPLVPELFSFSEDRSRRCETINCVWDAPFESRACPQSGWRC